MWNNASENEMILSSSCGLQTGGPFLKTPANLAGPKTTSFTKFSSIEENYFES